MGRDIPVRPGARVEAGDPLGKSGTPGYVKVPLLHFSVLRVDGEGSPQSIDIRFDDGTPEGVVPIAGKSYPEG
jgi:murein DD-endopeptidase MepM/ murein hydrolase activator NlpD